MNILKHKRLRKHTQDTGSINLRYNRAMRHISDTWIPLLKIVKKVSSL